jgi:hypothetical protein
MHQLVTLARGELFLSQDDGELGFAGFGRIVEGGAFAIGFRGAEEKSLFGIFGQADEAGFAFGVGSDLQVELVKVHESVGDVDADVGGVDRGTVGVGNGEINRARAEASINFGDGFRVGLRSGRLGGQGSPREKKNHEYEEDKRGESRSD